MKKKYLLIIVFILSYKLLLAQSVLDETRNWRSLENIDLYTNQSFPDTFLIAINKTELKLKNDGVERTFQISDLEGTWTNLSDAGKLTFNVTIRDFTGKGSVEREGGNIVLTVDFSERKDWMKRKYIIND
jgi:hypothetical protein